jgi:hypothetical protein
MTRGLTPRTGRRQRVSRALRQCAGSSGGLGATTTSRSALALLLIAAAIVVAAALPRPIAYLMGLSGLTYLVQGWVVGSEGFSETHTVLILVAWVLTLAWMIWLAVVAWRMPDWDASRTS